MIPVQHVMPEAVLAVVRRAPLTPEKVAFAWRMAVGAQVDNATRVELRDGTLHVLARETGWRREVEHLAGIIRSRMTSMLGPDVVRSIKVDIP